MSIFHHNRSHQQSSGDIMPMRQELPAVAPAVGHAALDGVPTVNVDRLSYDVPYPNRVGSPVDVDENHPYYVSPDEFGVFPGLFNPGISNVDVAKTVASGNRIPDPHQDPEHEFAEGRYLWRIPTSVSHRRQAAIDAQRMKRTAKLSGGTTEPDTDKTTVLRNIT